MLAWVLLIHHAAIVYQGSGPSPSGATTTPQPPCAFGTQYEVLNATTGHSIVIAAHG
jgi:hypothetical protein